MFRNKCLTDVVNFLLIFFLSLKTSIINYIINLFIDKMSKVVQSKNVSGIEYCVFVEMYAKKYKNVFKFTAWEIYDNLVTIGMDF